MLFENCFFWIVSIEKIIFCKDNLFLIEFVENFVELCMYRELCMEKLVNMYLF